jgi:hypothetical protein
MSKRQAQPAKISTFRERDDWICQMLAADNEVLSPTAKVLTARVALHLHVADGALQVGTNKLGAGIGISERQARRLILEAEAAGWIHVNRSGGWHANSYQLMVPETRTPDVRVQGSQTRTSGVRVSSKCSRLDPGQKRTNTRTSGVRQNSVTASVGGAEPRAPQERGGAGELVLAGGFEDLRAAWPRPWADDDAVDRSAFEQATRHASVEDIIAGAAPWAAAMEPRYLPSLAKWLGAKGWQKPPPDKPKPKQRGNGKVDMAKLMLTQEGGFEEDDDGNLFDPAEGRLQ